MRLARKGVNAFKNFGHYCTAQFKPEPVREVWHPVIGLEIHAQILSSSKLFSRVCAKYGAPPNTQVGIFEAAHPGTLPALNRRCVVAAVKTALALGARINKVSRFDRKHYFYPDLPAGYQITQKDHPIASDGVLNFLVANRRSHLRHYWHSARLTQLQLEEDSGKSIHDADFDRVLVDLNRAGLPLMEFVFAPDLKSAEEAAALVKELSLILSRIGTCSCRMEEGALRVDANISVHRADEPYGERTEVKNINSIRALVKAINYEIERQVDLLEAGDKVANETRRFDSVNNVTVKMRDKDTIHDYRFMPEPNLPPLRLHDSSEIDCVPNGSLDIHRVRESMEELPGQTRQKLMRDYGVSLEYAIVLVNNDALLDYFLAVISTGNRSSQVVLNLLLNNLMGTLNSLDVSIEESMLSATAFGELVDLLESGEIHYAIALKVIKAICNDEDKRTPTEIVYANNWMRLSDDLLVEYVLKVLTSNSKLIAKYRRGKKGSFQALMGKAVVATEGRADMQKLQDLLQQKLDESSDIE